MCVCVCVCVFVCVCVYAAVVQFMCRNYGTVHFDFGQFPAVLLLFFLLLFSGVRRIFVAYSSSFTSLSEHALVRFFCLRRNFS